MINENETNPPLRLPGIERISKAFIHQDVEIAGMASFLVDFECNSMRVAGTCKARGNLTIQGNLDNAGMLRVNGDATIKRHVHSSGTMRILHNLTISQGMDASGIVTVDGAVSVSGSMEVTGITKLRDSVEIGQDFDSRGILRVDGNLTARNVIIARRFDLNLRPFNKITQSTISGNLIAGGFVELKNVKIEGNVYGGTVRLGKNSQVKGTLYYLNQLENEKNVYLENQPVQITPDQLAYATPAKLENTAGELEVEEISHRGITTCPECNRDLEGNPRFCTYCGFRFTQRQ